MVFSSKKRYPYFECPQVRNSLIEQLQIIAAEKSISIDTINAYNDHVHCLINLNNCQRVDEIMHSLKGASSKWLNGSGLLERQFIWAKGYYAASVDGSTLSLVRRYIQNQEKHHSMHKQILSYLDTTIDKECIPGSD